MLNIIINIVCFMLGGSIGVLTGAFMAAVGTKNKEFEQYCQGFSEGYRKKAKQVNENNNRIDK